MTYDIFKSFLNHFEQIRAKNKAFKTFFARIQEFLYTLKPLVP